MKNILKLGLILTLYAAAACVGLALVYTGTKQIIENRQEADLIAALEDLFPEADKFRNIDGVIPSPESGVRFEQEYEARRGDALVGAAIRASRESYGGPVTILVGVGVDGKVSRVKILDHKDTPGLGANAASPTYLVNKSAGITFYGQFAGKSAGDPFEVMHDVAAITAATITSRAVSSTVRASGRAAAEWLARQGDAAQRSAP